MPHKHNMTTSIRLPSALRAQLEQAARALHRGKSWIIVHALESYLEKLQFNLLAEEAHRQSLLAAKRDNDKEDQSWEDSSDTSGWK